MAVGQTQAPEKIEIKLRKVCTTTPAALVKDLISKLDPAGTKLANRKILDGIDPESQSSNPILVFVDLN